MQLRRNLLMQIVGGGDMGLWKQKQVTVQSAIALGDGFANLIASNIPSGTTFVMIVIDNLNPQSFINNQLVVGIYDSANSSNNIFSRYRNNSYSQTNGNFNIWSSTYALTASQGDTYSLIYQ